MLVGEYKEEIVNELKARALSDNMTDREAFFNIYCEKLEESELIEDYEYLYFVGKGSRNRSVQIDGYAYAELDEKLTLFIMPPLSYYTEVTLTKTEADNYFRRAIGYFLEAEKVIEGAEESSPGYGLALDIINKRLNISRIEVIIMTDNLKSNALDVIPGASEGDIKVEYKIYDVTRMKLIDESANGKEPLIIDLKKDFESKGIPVLEASKTEKYISYMANIPGEILAKMYDKYQSRLLEGNVRSFLQTKGSVNKGIRVTILNNPEMFFAYNNGIAATAEELQIENTPNGLMVTGFKALQIVNGGQTTASLASAWTNDVRFNSREQIKKIFVPMKISVVAPDVARDLIPNISRYANSQNKVNDADLASNHPFHIKMEDLSRRIIAPAVDGAQFGTYWYYERANGQYKQETYKASKAVKKNFESKNPKNQMFKKVDLAKLYNIYMQKPHFASLGSQRSFLKFSEWMIVAWDKNENQFNEEFFKKIVALNILFKSTDRIVREQAWYQSYKANIVAYTLSIIFKKAEEMYVNEDIDLMHIWKTQKISQSWIETIEEVSFLMYEHLTSTDRPVENVTEWAKREASWERAKQVNFTFNTSFKDNLISKSASLTEAAAAIREEKANKEFNALVEMANLGESFWKELRIWGDNEHIWSYRDNNFLSLATKFESGGKIPTDKQAIKILELLEKARAEGFPK